MGKRNLSPTTAISLVALFFSLTGAGLAASRYLITSPRQIAPRVLSELRGERGPVGPRGPSGATATTASASLPFDQVIGGIVSLDAEQPQAIARVQCPAGERVVSGGYMGYGEIVTMSDPFGPTEETSTTYAPDLGPDYWEVEAHLDPAASVGFGFIRAVALCSHGST